MAAAATIPLSFDFDQVRDVLKALLLNRYPASI